MPDESVADEQPTRTRRLGGTGLDGGGRGNVVDEGFRRRALRSAVTLVVTVGTYYALPIGRFDSTAAFVISVVGLLAGVPVLGWLAASRIRRFMTGSRADPVRIEGLMAIIYILIVAFSAGYFGLDRADGDQFVGLQTKTDALYFTVVTLGTVGYGDIHAAGQLARGLVAIQIVFDLVVVGTLVTVVTGVLRDQAQVRARRSAPR